MIQVEHQQNTEDNLHNFMILSTHPITLQFKSS